MLGRRAMMRGIGLAPFTARRRRVGWESNSIFQVVIVTGVKSGVFVYAPSPGFAKLVASIASSPGTDAFGNAYLPEIVAYDQSAVIASQLNGPALQFFSAPGAGGPWSTKASVSGDAGGDLLLNALPAHTVQAIQQMVASAGLSVTGGETADTIAVSSGQAGGVVLDVTNTTAAPTAANLRLTCAA